MAIIPRLTQAERNKQKRRIIHEAIVKRNKLAKLRNNVDVKQIIEEVESEVSAHKEKIEERKKKNEEELKYKTKRVGKERLGERDVEVLMTSELPRSLKNFNPTTSLLEDRFYSFQKRNLIEPRSEKDYRRRYKLKLKFNIRQMEYIKEQDKKYGLWRIDNEL